MQNDRQRLQIGQFAELVGLSVPQLRRYDHLDLLAPEGRSEAGYRYYSASQTGAGRAIALLRSIDMPIAEVRRILGGITEREREQLFTKHRARLEARLAEVQGLMDAVDQLAKKDTINMNAATELSSWLHFMPRIPVSDIDQSISYYQEVLGFRMAWQTTDQTLTALASGPIELLLLVPWVGEGEGPPSQSAYIYVDDPDTLCAEYAQAGASIVDAVANRSYGMRDFTVSDPDGHQFTLGRDGESLRDVASHYGLDREEIVTDPDWLATRR